MRRTAGAVKNAASRCGVTHGAATGASATSDRPTSATAGMRTATRRSDATAQRTNQASRMPAAR
jgi:hypothetical protein